MLVPHSHTIVESPLFASFTVVDKVVLLAIVVDGVAVNFSILILVLSMVVTFPVNIPPAFVPSHSLAYTAPFDERFTLAVLVQLFPSVLV